MPEFIRPQLYKKQEEAIFCPERYALIEASTKSGKTVGCIVWIIEQALRGKRGYNYWWVAPGYNQADIAFRRVKQNLTPGTFTPYETPQPRIVLLTGAVIWFKSAENDDALYGEDVYAAVVDEASRVKEASWFAIRSTLTATRGPVRLIGNVKGRKNWFYTMARKAQLGAEDMHYAQITVLDAIEAGVLDQAEIDDARRNLPDMIFRELYMAEASDDGGNPFGIDHIRACLSPTLGPGPVVSWGIDLAKRQDWFVCVGLNIHGGVAGFARWRGLRWEDSVTKAWGLIGQTPTLVDSTGVGDPVLEAMQKEHPHINGYHFTQPSKMKLIEGLIVAIQSSEVAYPDGPKVAPNDHPAHIRHELEDFEYETTRTGVKYAAAEGCNDDCVMALALAYQQFTRAPAPWWLQSAQEWVPPSIMPIFAR